MQDLPPEGLRRYAFKMATGSGKTWVMAIAVVWSHFHKRRVADSELSTNFLIVAPNIIVYQRLEKDFASNRIFHTLNGSTLASIRLISRHECHEPWPRQYRAWLYFKTTGTKRKSPASWPA